MSSQTCFQDLSLSVFPGPGWSRLVNTMNQLQVTTVHLTWTWITCSNPLTCISVLCLLGALCIPLTHTESTESEAKQHNPKYQHVCPALKEKTDGGEKTGSHVVKAHSLSVHTPQLGLSVIRGIFISISLKRSVVSWTIQKYNYKWYKR